MLKKEINMLMRVHLNIEPNNHAHANNVNFFSNYINFFYTRFSPYISISPVHLSFNTLIPNYPHRTPIQNPRIQI
jgi:hypothetical protein